MNSHYNKGMKKLSLFLLIMLVAGQSAIAGKPIVDKSKGYVGELPELGKQYQDSEPAQTKPQYEATKNFNSENQVKPAPRDNPAFVNIILKADKTTQYINDINELLPTLEKIYDSIENEEDVQKFVATTYFFNKTIEYLREKYQDKPEFYFVSFQKILETDLHIQTVTNLRVEAVRNTPYMAYGADGKIYNSVNIDEQLAYLQKEIEETIAIIKGVY